MITCLNGFVISCVLNQSPAVTLTHSHPPPISPTVEFSHQLSLSLPRHCRLHLSSEYSRGSHHGDLAVAWDNKDQVGSGAGRIPWGTRLAQGAYGSQPAVLGAQKWGQGTWVSVPRDKHS